jgi:isoleucyl-tRNA synthetase
MDEQLRAACEGFQFHGFFSALHNFCAVDLSAFYFDVRKDALYCDVKDSLRRRAARTVMDQIFTCLTAWLAPVLVFTAEEAWLARFPSEDGSVHLRTFPDIPAEWRDDALAQKWDTIRKLRRVVTGALEIERANGVIGSGLQAAPTVYATRDYLDALSGLSLAEIAITSGANLVEGEGPAQAFRLPDVPGVAVVPAVAGGAKCQRCWQVLTEVGSNPQHDDICNRCADAVGPSLASVG